MHILGFAGREQGEWMGLEQEVQNGLQPLQLVLVVPSCPPGLGCAAGHSLAGLGTHSGAQDTLSLFLPLCTDRSSAQARSCWFP